VSQFSRFVGGDRVKDAMDLDLAVSLAMDHNFIILGRRGRTCIRLAHELSTFSTLALEVDRTFAR